MSAFKKSFRVMRPCVGVSVLGMATAVSAQTQPVGESTPAADEAGFGLEEVIVSARRREETSISVPVVIATISADEMQRRGVVDLEGIARVTPQLVIAAASGSVQGGAVALRGIGAGDSNPLGDQAVAFNIDGVQVARSSVRRMAEFDMAQVEVLKGPQALYFGKNSPGGIVVISSKDPGDQLEMGATVGYEFNAEQVRTDGFISAPLTPTLGARLALFSSDMDGWVDNVTPASAQNTPRDRTATNVSEYGGRLTLVFEPGEVFNARLKAAYSSMDSAGAAENTQRVRCPFGAPQSTFGEGDDCVANDTVVRAELGPNFGLLNPLFGDGRPFADQEQTLAGLEMNLNVTPSLVLSSQSGYYKSELELIENFNANSASNPTALASLLAFSGSLSIEEKNQELRLTSNFDGRFDFMVGGNYQQSDISYTGVTARNATTPTYAGVGTPSISEQEGDAYSIFGQVSFNPIDTLELSAGGRYSEEKKTFHPLLQLTGTPYDPTLPGGTARPERSWHDFSPEYAIAWRPSDIFTVFAAYKHGFLSGGFNGGNGNLGLDRSYDQQEVEGYEVGLKGLFFDESLRLETAVFTYDITGQQVSSLIGVTQFITNAGSSLSEGAEVNAVWNTPLTGLTLRAGAAYNDAHYESYVGGPCYAGQTPAQGCTLAGGATSQDLSGQTVVRAPEWGGILGASFATQGPWNSELQLAVDSNYSSALFTEGTNNPQSEQDSYWLLDASIQLQLDNGLTFSVVGRNLTNEYYFLRGADTPFTGSGTGTAAGVRADTVAFVSRGRELMLRVGYDFH